MSVHGGIRPLRFVCGQGVASAQDKTLAAWAEILEIN